jgi:uncharacterized integral membrane protein
MHDDRDGEQGDGSTELAPDRTAQTPDPTPRTRTSWAWASLVAGLVVLLLLIIFVLENSERVTVTFYGAKVRIIGGVVMILAALFGALVVGLVGGARILQLRSHARRAAGRHRSGRVASER